MTQPYPVSAGAYGQNLTPGDASEWEPPSMEAAVPESIPEPLPPEGQNASPVYDSGQSASRELLPINLTGSDQ